MKKQNKGITLIALVITIIVLLIIAGVTIVVLTGENGILTNSSTANAKNAYYEAEEQVKLAYMSVKIEISLNSVADVSYNAIEHTSELADIVSRELEKENFEVDGSTEGEIKIAYKNPKLYKNAISEGKPKQNGSVNYLINIQEKTAELECDVDESKERAKFNARSLYRFMHDGMITKNNDGTYSYGNIDGKGKRIKNVIVAIRKASEIPEWAVDKNWNKDLGRNSEYAWLSGSNMGEQSTIYSLPILLWLDVQNLTIYWYSQDNKPELYYNNQYGTQIGFNGCNELTDISGIQNWDVSKLDQMEGFFSGCLKLTNLGPIKNWNVSNVVSMKNAFKDMTSLTDASAINNWDIKNVTNFQEMFRNTSIKPEFTKVNGTFLNNGTFVPEQ